MNDAEARQHLGRRFPSGAVVTETWTTDAGRWFRVVDSVDGGRVRISEDELLAVLGRLEAS